MTDTFEPITLDQVATGDRIQLHNRTVTITHGAHRPFGDDAVRIQYSVEPDSGRFNYTGMPDELIARVIWMDE